MKKHSEIMGVHYLRQTSTWIAKDVHKKTLYRGKDQKYAEAARISYDVERGKKIRIKRKHETYGYNKKERFNNCWQPDWPATTKI